VDIHTNAVCNDCKHRIETEMLYEKGVQKVTVDLDKEIIHVEYKAKKTDPDKLRQAVSKIGYLADDVQPDAKARAALPSCCQMTREEHDAAPAPAPAPTPAPQP
jgi:copper chaperone CopZ